MGGHLGAPPDSELGVQRRRLEAPCAPAEAPDARRRQRRAGSERLLAGQSGGRGQPRRGARHPEGLAASAVSRAALLRAALRATLCRPGGTPGLQKATCRTLPTSGRGLCLRGPLGTD